jgi:hypothetical protein
MRDLTKSIQLIIACCTPVKNVNSHKTLTLFRQSVMRIVFGLHLLFVSLHNVYSRLSKTSSDT